MLIPFIWLLLIIIGVHWNRHIIMLVLLLVSWKDWKHILFIITLAIAINFAADASWVISSSMFPTLFVGDYVVTNRKYGYSRYAFPFGWYLKYFQGRYFIKKDIEPGDIVSFYPEGNPNKDYIKRVIATAGQTTQMINGKLYVDGIEVKRNKIGDIINEDGDSCILYEEILANGAKYNICKLKNIESTDMSYLNKVNNTPLYTVPEGYIFVLGDNRDQSDDGRGKLRYVSIERIVGTVEHKAFSYELQRPIWKNIFKWPSAIRYKEIFKKISPK